jgi:hypothetical protein
MYGRIKLPLNRHDFRVGDVIWLNRINYTLAFEREWEVIQSLLLNANITNFRQIHLDHECWVLYSPLTEPYWRMVFQVSKERYPGS